MSKLLKGSIDLTKVKNARKEFEKSFFTNENGTKLNVNIWVNDAPDQWGNHASISLYNADTGAKLYVGNAKLFERQPPVIPTAPAPSQPAEEDDLPF